MPSMKELLESAKKIDDNLKGVGPNDPQPTPILKRRKKPAKAK